MSKTEQVIACSRRDKWIGGCKFEPRYDLAPADISRMTSLSGHGTGLFLEKLQRQTYIGDVYIRCGLFIQRPVNENVRSS